MFVGKKGVRLFNAIKEVGRQFTLGFSIVCRRVHDFRDVRKDLLLKHHSGTKFSATDRI